MLFVIKFCFLILYLCNLIIFIFYDYKGVNFVYVGVMNFMGSSFVYGNYFFDVFYYDFIFFYVMVCKCVMVCIFGVVWDIMNLWNRSMYKNWLSK